MSTPVSAHGAVWACPWQWCDRAAARTQRGGWPGAAETPETLPSGMRINPGRVRGSPKKESAPVVPDDEPARDSATLVAEQEVPAMPAAEMASVSKLEAKLVAIEAAMAHERETMALAVKAATHIANTARAQANRTSSGARIWLI